MLQLLGSQMMRVALGVNLGAEEEPILRVAARRGFWAFGTQRLLKFREHLGLQVERGIDLYAILHKLCGHLMDGWPPETAMDAWAQRLGTYSEEAQVYEELFQIDEGFEILSTEDTSIVAGHR